MAARKPEIFQPDWTPFFLFVDVPTDSILNLKHSPRHLKRDIERRIDHRGETIRSLMQFDNGAFYKAFRNQM
jgi:hypothetical protein